MGATADRDDAPASQAREGRVGAPRHDRRPWSPQLRVSVLASTLLLAGAVARVAPLSDAGTGAPATGVELRMPAAYVVLAPFCQLADWLTGLPLHVHFELMLSIIVTGLLWPSRRPIPRGALGWSGELARRAVGALGALVTLYAVAVLAPRPVARLRATDPDEVVVDFHSHTSASHDGRRGFDAAANRAWHRAVGFDVAYVTDHASFASVDAAAAANPRRAGAGVTLLPAVEVRAAGRHVNVLGVAAADSLAYVGGALRDSASTARDGAPRVVVLTLPAKLHALPRGLPLGAIEVSDASPRGLAQVDRERGAILALAEGRGLALVSGSNNHGWASNAVAWTLVRVPGWRDMAPDSLDRAIRRTLAAAGRAAARVVERRRPTADARSLASPFDVLASAGWALCRALTWPERLACLAWLWLPVVVRRVSRRTPREPAPGIVASPSGRGWAG